MNNELLESAIFDLDETVQDQLTDMIDELEFEFHVLSSIEFMGRVHAILRVALNSGDLASDELTTFAGQLGLHFKAVKAA